LSTELGIEWHTLAIPALGRLRQEDHEFKTTSLSYIVTPCLKIKKKKEEEEEDRIMIMSWKCNMILQLAG
jgi:hypothetical protein